MAPGRDDMMSLDLTWPQRGSRKVTGMMWHKTGESGGSCLVVLRQGQGRVCSACVEEHFTGHVTSSVPPHIAQLACYHRTSDGRPRSKVCACVCVCVVACVCVYVCVFELLYICKVFLELCVQNENVLFLQLHGASPHECVISTM